MLRRIRSNSTNWFVARDWILDSPFFDTDALDFASVINIPPWRLYSKYIYVVLNGSFVNDEASTIRITLSRTIGEVKNTDTVEVTAPFRLA